MTQVYDITINQGATYQLVVTWNVSGSPVDLTGYTAALQARYNVDASTTFISLTSGSGLTLGGALGTITVDLTAAQTAALTCFYGVYDLELTAPDGTVTRLLQGTVTVSKEVTR